MKHWFTRPDLLIDKARIKRFEPSHWTVDCPRGSMASVVSFPGEARLEVHARFARKGDIVGLIFDSEDRHVHVAHRREHAQDYSNTTLSFCWETAGLIALDAINGATLTIEGHDASGSPKSWYVRLANYAEILSQKTRITLPFDRLDGGYLLPAEATRVDPRRITRMFISLVPPGFQAGLEERYQTPPEARVTLSEMACSGSGSVIDVNDAYVPEVSVGICTAYDDLYHLTPERVIDSLETSGVQGHGQPLCRYEPLPHYQG